jgi:hypothetical protein
MIRATVGGLLVVCAAASPALAAVVVDVGDRSLLPNTPGQVFQIFVDGGDPVTGVQFNLQVADGGPEGAQYGGPGLIDGPEIENVDIFTGTIFATNNVGELGGGSIAPQLWESWTSTTSGTVPAQGLLATVTIDTTGFFAGTWDLWMAPTLQGDSTLLDSGIEVVIENGSINVIPEPSAVAVWSLLGIAGLFLVARRRKHAR